MVKDVKFFRKQADKAERVARAIYSCCTLYPSRHGWMHGVSGRASPTQGSPVHPRAGRRNISPAKFERITGPRAICDDAKAGHERGRQL